jgi:chemotaxis signal transduction protein
VSAGRDLELRLQELRQRFDAGFAEPPPMAAEKFEDLLAIRLGAEQYLLRLREVETLCLERAVTPVPSRVPHVLGVADFRGELVAVYDLAALLGYPAAQRARYLLRSSQRPVAFAVEHLEGHVRLTLHSLSQVPSTRARPGREQTLAAHAASIIDLTGLVSKLEEQAGRASSEEA